MSNQLKITRSIRKTIWLICLCSFLFPCFTSAQGGLKDGNAKREEIQRYFGYETLMYRYLSIPYDLTMNTNERGDFVDIGFLFLILLPLLFFIKYREKLWVLLGIPAMLIFIFIISTSNGFVFDHSANQLLVNNNGQTDYAINPEADGIGMMFIKSLYNFNNVLYTPFNKLGNAISGEQDYITYPLVLLIFIGLCALLFFNFRKNGSWFKLLTAAFFLLYIFFWYILSSGIIWYGFYGWLLGVVCMVLLLPSDTKEKIDKWTYIGTYSVIALWLVVGLFSRMSNINPGGGAATLGKNMINPIFLQQLVGKSSEKQILDMFYHDLGAATKKINRDKEALVYRVGTSFSYFIDNNHKRVFMDNQLGFFRRLEKRYPDKQERANVLKASNFRYLIIDLNTPTLDNTPEQSLVDKYNGLIEFVYKNPKVKLLATNRKVKVLGPDGKPTDQLAFNIFGKVVSNGTFAIYEIL